MPALEHLELTGNRLEGSVPAISGAVSPNFKSLLLGNNSLTGTIPASVCSLDKMEDLILAENALTGPIPAGLAGAKALRTVDISCNALSGSVPALPVKQFDTCFLGGPDYSWCSRAEDKHNRYACPLPDGVDQECDASCV